VQSVSSDVMLLLMGCYTAVLFLTRKLVGGLKGNAHETKTWANKRWSDREKNLL